MADLDARQRELLDFWAPYEADLEGIQAEMRRIALALPDFGAVLGTRSEAQLREDEATTAALQRRAILDDDWAPYRGQLRGEGATYARHGIEFSRWFVLIRQHRKLLTERIVDHYGEEIEKIHSAFAGMNSFLDFTLSVVGDGYVETKEEIIGNQQEAIRELSTPVLQVRPRLLVVPLVGMMDTYRARQLTEAVLVEIRDRRARVVIMDVTGVPIVDSKVANHLVQTVEAAGLMGARVIVTGISAGIARTLVTIGAELPGIRTLQDLQAGIVEAERLLGLQVIASSNAPDEAERPGSPEGG